MVMSDVKEISVKELLSLQRDGETFALKLHASWCGPCKSFAPAFGAVAQERAALHDSYSLQIDSEENDADATKLLADLGIRGVPAVVFVKDGDVIGTAVGLMTRDLYQRKLIEHLGA